MTWAARARIAGALTACALAGTGCSGGVDTSATYTFEPDSAPVDVDTPDLRAAKAAAGIARCPASDIEARPGADGIPALVLPCLGGGRDVNLAGLGTPAVLNLWAQYCGPCRTEAPLFQQVYEAARGDVAVIGIDWQDPLPGQAVAFAAEYDLTYPQLADPEGATRGPLRMQGLPMTVFVEADGTVAFVHPDVVASADELADMVDEHLGVAVRL